MSDGNAATPDIKGALKLRMKKLPAISPAAQRIISLVNEGGDDAIQQVSGIIETDPPLTASVLKAANSAAFAFRGEVASVRRAVNLLGTRFVYGVAMAATVAAPFRAISGRDADALWEHSIFTALLARILAGYLATPISPEMAYLAGLLHDIGKTLIFDYYVERKTDILSFLDDGSAGEFHVAETAVLGVNHADSGALLAEQWKLPASLAEAIRSHHQPAAAGGAARQLVYVVHVADMLAMWTGWSTRIDALRYQLDPGFAEVMNIASPRVDRILLSASAEMSGALEAFRTVR